MSFSLKDKLIHYKQLEQPAAFFLAESNPRWTNYTDAIGTVLIANGQEHTIENMQEVIRKGIRTVDKVTVPNGVDIDRLRGIMLEHYDVEDRRDGLTILRTSPIEVRGEPQAKRKMGVIFTINQGEENVIEFFDKSK